MLLLGGNRRSNTMLKAKSKKKKTLLLGGNRRSNTIMTFRFDPSKSAVAGRESSLEYN